MKPATWERVREVFERALALPPDERGAFVEASCSDDDGVRAEVVRLLAEDELASDFLEGGAPAVSQPRAAAPPRAPTVTGTRIADRYELVREIATGGMGTVYEAVQDVPRRSVALKMMRFGLSSSSAERRFRFEAEVLARLHHVGIAQIYEWGIHREGEAEYPFFAMELVEDARDLLEHAEVEGLALRQRVGLFIDVCAAVHHGHQRGVIHRDLKPGNILVDPSGRPKVIDFGVARAVAPDGPDGKGSIDQVTLTLAGQVVGTLRYMSPEQLGALPGDVDTRSDVYALGCILQELLTGDPAHDFSDTPLVVVTQRLAHEEPRRPSGLPDDLGWIVVKCLAKEPERRYSSASELAADLRRFLDHEPVLAGAPSATYRLRKLVRRHRLFLSAVAAVVLALAIGLVRAEQEARAATSALELANRETEKAGGVSGFLRTMLTSVGSLSKGKDARVLDVLDQAARSIEEELAGQPEAQALVRNVIAETYIGMWQFEEAREHLDAALAFVEAELPPGDPLRLDVQTNQARLLLVTFRRKAAEEPLRGLETLALAHLAPDHDLTLRIQATLAELLMSLMKTDEAETRFDAVIAAFERRYGPGHEEVIASLGGRALTWMRQGRLDEARVEFERVLAMAEENLPEESWRIDNARINLAFYHRYHGKLDETERMGREILARARENLGEGHPLLVNILCLLGDCLGLRNLCEEALPLYEEAWEISMATYGEGTLDDLRIRDALARLHYCLGNLETAELVCREALDLGCDGDPEVFDLPAQLRQVLAITLADRGRIDEAEEVLREALEIGGDDLKESMREAIEEALDELR